MKSILKTLLISIINVVLIFNNLAFANPLLDKLEEYESYYYDPTSNSEDCDLEIGDYDGIKTPGLSALQAEFVDKYHNIASQLGKEYGIPWETVVAQGIIESASGTSKFAMERNNFFGIKAFDSNPNLATTFSSPSAGWRGYFENISKTPTYRKHNAFNFPNDPYGYLNAIHKAGYASDPNYVKTTSSIIRAIEKRAELKGWELSRNSNSNQLKQVDNYCSNIMTLSRGISSGNKNINLTAIALSWPDTMSGKKLIPKPAYTKALAQTGVNRLGDRCSMTGKSCDAFVATVLRYSGIDSNALCCGANRMLNYLKQHPEIYEKIPNLGNTSNLRPGDIRSKPSHIEIIIKKPNESSFRIASASHCDRTADHGSNFYPDSAYQIFRVKHQNKGI